MITKSFELSNTDVETILATVDFTDPIVALETAEIAGSSLRSCGNLAITEFIRGLVEHTGDTSGIVTPYEPQLLIPDLPTPTPPSAETFFAIDAVRCALIASGGGLSYAFDTQADGHICNDVVYAEGLQSNSSKVAGVPWHTEAAPAHGLVFSGDNLAYDGLSLAFIRNPNEEPVTLSEPNLNELSQRSQEILRTPCVSSTHRLGPHIIQPVITDQINGASTFWFNEEALRRDTVYQSNDVIKAVHEFTELVSSSACDILVPNGSILFFDNRRAAHGRPPVRVQPRYDGTDRWQRRCGFSSQTVRLSVDRMSVSPRVVGYRQLVSKIVQDGVVR